MNASQKGKKEAEVRRQHHKLMMAVVTAALNDHHLPGIDRRQDLRDACDALDAFETGSVKIKMHKKLRPMGMGILR